MSTSAAGASELQGDSGDRTEGGVGVGNLSEDVGGIGGASEWYRSGARDVGVTSLLRYVTLCAFGRGRRHLRHLPYEFGFTKHTAKYNI